MAKRQARVQGASRQQVEEAASNLLRRSALTLSKEGWSPDSRDRNVFEVVSRIAREMWPRDEASRDRVAARAFAMLLERLRRRYPEISIDTWERDVYREPEDVIASMASHVFPWSTSGVVSPQETTIQAFMVLQVLNSPDIGIPALCERAQAAMPSEWIPDDGAIDRIASDVLQRVRNG